MKRRCQHEWEETGRDYGGKIVDNFDMHSKGWPGAEVMEMMQDAFYGWTILSMRCKHCGQLDTVKLQGHLVDSDYPPV